MDGPVCGFCMQGKSVERVCGPLCTSDGCVAHYRCMQYSSCLVQYKSKKFGGFKVKKVMAEIGRGRRLQCSICKKKNRRTKKKYLSRGASAGCAHAACGKTYHYYCAATDDEVLTKRIETVDHETSQKAVLYRIFCSKKHQIQFEKDSKLEMDIEYNSCSSESELESEKEHRPADPQSDTSSSDDSDTELSKSSSKKHKKRSQVAQSSSAKRGRPSTSKDQVQAEKTAKAASTTGTGTSKAKHQRLSTSENSRRSSRESHQKVKTALVEDSPAKPSPVTEDPESESTDAMIYSEKNKTDAPSRVLSLKLGKADERVSSANASPTAIQTVLSSKRKADEDDGEHSEDLFDEDNVGTVHRIRTYTGTPDSKKQTVECRAKTAVCLMQDWQTREKLRGCAKLYVQNQFGVPESGVHLWHPSKPNFTYEHMLYYMKDVAKCITDSDTSELNELIFNFEDERFEKYNHCIQFHQDYIDEDLRDHVYQKVWDVTCELFREKRKKLNVEVGGPVLLSKRHCIFLVVLLTHDIDPDGSISRQLEGQAQVHKVEPSTEFLENFRYNAEDLKNFKEMEFSALQGWLKEQLGENPRYTVRPQESIMRDTSLSSITCLLCNEIQEREISPTKKRPKEVSSVSLFVVPVDPEIVAPRPYYQRLIPTYIEKELSQRNAAFVILDVDTLDGFHSVKDVVPNLPPNVTMAAYSGLDPLQLPVTCLVLHFTSQQH